MGRIFLDHIGGTRLFSCANCDTILTNRSELISTRFTGATGRAFLFNKRDSPVIKMSFIKEESEDVRIEDTFKVKHEDPEEQTDLLVLKEEREDLNDSEDRDQLEEHHDFATTEDGDASDTFSCQECGKSFSNRGNLKLHLIVHSGEKPFVCRLCGKSFSRKGSLKTHMSIHSGEKPHSCQQCGRTFNLKGNLRAHIKVHTGEKPFTCERCGKSFTRRDILHNHMSIHVRESCLTCSQCGMSFSRNANLKVHMRIHT